MIAAVDSDGTIPSSEALAACLLREDVTRAECEAIVEAGRTVAGRYCSGRLVIDETGRHCFAQGALEARARAAAASPLPERAAPKVSNGWKLAAVAAAAVVAWRVFK